MHARSIFDRLFERIDMTGGPDACWTWKGRGLCRGYGKITVPGMRSSQFAHRLMLWMAKGAPPDDKPWALHSCDNRLCCNPLHLTWSTPFANSRDCDRRGRRNHFAARSDRGAKDSLAAVQLEAIVAERDTSYAGLAFELGVSKPVMFRWAKGDRRPKLALAEMLQERLAIPMEAWTKAPAQVAGKVAA